MNLTQFKCLAVFGLLLITGFGPISMTCLIGFYVVLMRPNWFWELMVNLYANLPRTRAFKPVSHARIKCFFSLIVLFILDIAPVPVNGVIGIGIVLTRPLWFYNLVANIYDKHSAEINPEKC